MRTTTPSTHRRHSRASLALHIVDHGRSHAARATRGVAPYRTQATAVGPYPLSCPPDSYHARHLLYPAPLMPPHHHGAALLPRPSRPSSTTSAVDVAIDSHHLHSSPIAPRPNGYCSDPLLPQLRPELRLERPPVAVPVQTTSGLAISFPSFKTTPESSRTLQFWLSSLAGSSSSSTESGRRHPPTSPSFRPSPPRTSAPPARATRFGASPCSARIQASFLAPGGELAASLPSPEADTAVWSGHRRREPTWLFLDRPSQDQRPVSRTPSSDLSADAHGSEIRHPLWKAHQQSTPPTSLPPFYPVSAEIPEKPF